MNTQPIVAAVHVNNKLVLIPATIKKIPVHKKRNVKLHTYYPYGLINTTTGN